MPRPIDTLLRVDLGAMAIETAKLDIKFIGIDADGVLTDGTVYVNENGDELRHYFTQDGQSIKYAIKKGIHVGIIGSGNKAGSIEAWAKKWNVPYVYVGTDHKIEVLRKWCEKAGVELNQVAYIGDDVNDIPTLRRVGLSVCPGNAVAKVKAECNLHLAKDGGHGCIREFIESWIFPVEAPAGE